MQCTKFSVQFEFCVLFAVLVLLVPVQLLISWLVAVFVHELSHYIMLRVCGVKVYTMTFGLFGAIIRTEPMGYKQEIICALAGPVGGLSLLFLSAWFPYVSLLGVMQSVFNLLPIFPLDGGRVLRCITERYFEKQSDQICSAFKWMAICLIVFVLGFVFQAWKIIAVAVVIQVIGRKVLKFPCKEL